MLGRRREPDPRFFIGSGKVDELRLALLASPVDVVIVNQPLSPSQERNLEKQLGTQVLDRVGLILDIFAQRARSFEGKLQVELAQLRRLSTRLVRGWTHLERQRGGIGMRGPGETQLETDHRLIARRIGYIQKRLGKVDRQRELGRGARDRSGCPVVAIVGYTNAGKSTLFNSLTGAEVYSADQLFATLDPTYRRVRLSATLSVIVSDTVGFIRNLPHELIAAFRSTLQEAADADLLLHVIDVADPNRDATIAEVEQVLEEIGAGDTPRIQVFSKIDLTDEPVARREAESADRAARVWLCARKQADMFVLKSALTEYFQNWVVYRRVHLGVDEAERRASFYRLGEVLSEQDDGSGGWNMEVKLARRDAHLFGVAPKV